MSKGQQQSFIVTAKILTVMRNISAETAKQIAGRNIRLALYAERRAYCTTIMSIITTTVAATNNCNHSFFEWKAAAISAPSSLIFSASIASNKCVILYKLLLPQIAITNWTRRGRQPRSRMEPQALSGSEGAAAVRLRIQRPGMIQTTPPGCGSRAFCGAVRSARQQRRGCPRR